MKINKCRTRLPCLPFSAHSKTRPHGKSRSDWRLRTLCVGTVDHATLQPAANPARRLSAHDLPRAEALANRARRRITGGPSQVCDAGPSQPALTRMLRADYLVRNLGTAFVSF